MSDAKPGAVAVVGAGGAVGREAVGILIERGYDPASIIAFGSERSSGRVLEIGGTNFNIRAYTPRQAAECESAILCTDADVAARIAPELADLGVFVVDNSSHFRMHPEVPLVIPEINGKLITSKPNPPIVANPNCSTIMLLTALNPIRRAFGVESVVVTTYQAVSGAGAPAIDELYSETARALSGEKESPSVFPVSCAFNIFPHESARDSTGYSGEERKMIDESRRIWDSPTLNVLPTCVRVPVERAHAQSIVIKTASASSTNAIIEELRKAEGIRLHQSFELTPRIAAHTDQVHIGPVRESESDPGRTFVLWICCDQLRRGAALNAVECLILRSNTATKLTGSVCV